MKTLDNIKLEELSTEEKMNVNGGFWGPAIRWLAKNIDKIYVAYEVYKAGKNVGGKGGEDHLDDYDGWTKATN